MGRFRGWRAWVLRLSLVVLAPLTVLGLLEGCLRLAGYGYPTAFFVRSDADGSWSTNHRFGWRFFPRALSREPHPATLTEKPDGTVRIFVLGGSAAMGTPDPAFSFGRILEVMLREQYPDQRIEVVNAAMTAINSHVALEIARDCAEHEPDLFCVYLGNNEVVGPYGPGTVFQQWSPHRTLVRASLRARATRTGQWAGELMGGFGAKATTPARWRGMEMFLENPIPADDPRLDAVHHNYQRNLEAICAVAHRSGVGVVLATVAVNLRDCPPFASRHRPGLSAAELKQWEALIQAGEEAEAAENWPLAADSYEAAAQIDAQFAELQFRLGECLAKAGRETDATEHFEAARELDVLRFRADARINETVRAVAAAHASKGALLSDAEQDFAIHDRASQDGVEGALFYEHVHFTFDGNYRLARSVFDEVCAALPQLATAPSTVSIPSRERCAELLALTLWDEAQLADAMLDLTSKPPFTNQRHHERRQAAARRHRDALARQAATPAQRQASWNTYQTALAQSPDDWSLHRHFARLALQLEQHEVAAKHLRIAAKHLSRDASIQNNLGSALVRLGQFDEATMHFRKALDLDPGDEMAHFNLANLFAERGHSETAVAHYREAIRLEPLYAAAHFNLANLFAGSGRTEEAVTHYRKAIRIQPDDAEMHSNLGAVLADLGNLKEAIVHFQQALALRPGDPQIRRNLELAQSELRRRGTPAIPRGNSP